MIIDKKSDQERRQKYMFVYTDNKQVKNEFKKLTIDNNITMSMVADRLGIVPQQLNNKFNNSRLALSDLKQWLNIIGYDLELNFRKKEIENK